MMIMSKPEWSSAVWAIFFCVDGPCVIIVYTFFMTRDASAAWMLEHVQGRRLMFCLALGLGVLNEMMTRNGLMTRWVQLVCLCNTVAYYGLALPAVTLALHGPALGAAHLKFGLGCTAIPILLGVIITKLVGVHAPTK